MKIKELAALVQGVVDGDGEQEITGVSGIATAKPGDLTFALDETYLANAEKSRASCILTDAGMRKSEKCLIRVKNPKLAFLLAYNGLITLAAPKAFRHPTAVVAPSAKIGEKVWIGSHVTIEDDVVIGDRTMIESNTVVKRGCAIGPACRLHPNVTLYENTVLKNNVILHSGVVLGADGFGYVKEKGKIYKFPQLGRVIIEEQVEVGANTSIDRGSLSDTVIGAGTKIDNTCQIAHNVKIGKNVLIAAMAGIAGSAVIGDDVMFGGQVGVGDNVRVGKGAMLGAQSGVISEVKPGEIVWGIPARPIARVKRQMAVLSWLTKNFSRVKKVLGPDLHDDSDAPREKN